jgi:hypothetical protein
MARPAVSRCNYVNGIIPTVVPGLALKNCVGCRTSSSLSTDYDAWQINLTAANDHLFDRIIHTLDHTLCRQYAQSAELLATSVGLQQTPAGIKFAGETSYYAGGGLTITFGPERAAFV